MARIARVVVPGIPHHVTQRGVCRMETFFDEEDYKTYLSLKCTGRPLGVEGFIEKISCLVGRDLSKKKPGLKQMGN